jgi:anti-anti-sigma regulatory factor
VQPQGSLGGYGRNIVSSDLNGVLKAVEAYGIRVVVLNLGSWNYFGSEMIGMFFELRRSLPEDVRVVICDASRDMRTILESMNVQQVIPIYPTQREALNAAANVTLRDRVPSVKPLLPVVVVVLLLTAGVFGAIAAARAMRQWSAANRAEPEIATYKQFLSFQKQLLAMRNAETSPEAWSEFSLQVRDPVNAFLRAQEEDETKTQIQLDLVKAGQELLMIAGVNPQTPEHDIELYDALTSACMHLEQETGIELEEPRLTRP